MKKDYDKEIEMYSKLYELLIDGSFQENYPMMCERAFYNCMALAAELAFSSDMNENNQSSIFNSLSRKFMYLCGLNEEPDEMPSVLQCIDYTRAVMFNKLLDIHCKKCQIPESEYEKKIIQNFNKIKQFKNYNYINNQVQLKQLDRIDILAKDIDTNKFIIIELKKNKVSAHRQLRSYAVEFDQPILINISEKIVENKRDGIIYLTFNELFNTINEV